MSGWSRDDWRRWRALDGADRRLLVEAGIFVTLAEVSLKLLPFRRTARLFGLRENRSSAAPGNTPPGGRVPDAAARSAWAVERAATRTPLPGRCLAQALAGSAMLGRRRIPTTVHLGVAKDPRGTGAMGAHAWLRCGGAVLTGASGYEHFTPVAAFDVHV